jgi:hypothetical protein
MLLLSGLDSVRSVEQLTCPEHGVHDHCELPRDRDGGSLEADFLLELQTPGSQRAVCCGTREDYYGRFI